MRARERRCPTVPASQLDPESRRILALRAWPGPVASHFVKAATGDALVNMVDGPGRRRVSWSASEPASGGRVKPALAVCVEGRGHARLSCGSCHTAWAPRCPTCHTSFDTDGRGVRLGGRRGRDGCVEGGGRPVRGQRARRSACGARAGLAQPAGGRSTRSCRAW